MIDSRRWRDLQDNLQEYLADVVETFLEDSPLKLAEMRYWLESNMMGEVERVAHSFKSSAAIFGAQALVAAAQAVEDAASESPEKVDQCLIEMNALYILFSIELRKCLLAAQSNNEDQ